jgi:hypothetical protein
MHLDLSLNTDGELPSLPLHVALANGTPFDLIDRIVTANPRACEVFTDYHELPLHVALRFYQRSGGAPADLAAVVELLLRTYPESCRTEDHTGCLPLELALMGNLPTEVTLIVLSTFTAACEHSDGGTFPLHIAAEFSNMSLALMERLVLAHPAACMQMDSSSDGGEFPLQVALRFGAPAEVIALLEDASPGVPRVAPLQPWRRTRFRTRAAQAGRGRGRGLPPPGMPPPGMPPPGMPPPGMPPPG